MEASFRDKLMSALSLELPYFERSGLPEVGRAASVLFLFGRARAGGDEAKSGRFEDDLSILITRRTESVGSHKGQMAFPGGVSEPDELRTPDGPVRSALRETEEEVGLSSSLVEVVGTLPVLPTVTGFKVTPVVGWLRIDIEDVVLTLNEIEIAEAFWVPWKTLTSPETYRAEFKRVGKVDYPIHVYQVREHRIWGATGAMIKNLLDRLGSLG
jgi:8-oxo-dGTP pyrophosphatase MutT (NUDIX family)